ncbi:MAG: hypothetical protein ACKOKC_09305, partial [Chthoniobacterales bacterium]
TGDWRDKWFLDGEIGAAETTPAGLRVSGGPRFGQDAHHTVLWTKDSFEGDVKIEYDYTRLDFENRAVNILFIHATGSGTGPYARDITEWNELRKVPTHREKQGFGLWLCPELNTGVFAVVQQDLVG